MSTFSFFSAGPGTGASNTSPPNHKLKPEELRLTLRDYDEVEHFWAEHRDWLADTGYTLRPRYLADWEPSWPEDDFVRGANHEDGQLGLRASMMDVTRTKDGSFVMMKLLRKDRSMSEIQIGQLFSTEPLASNPRNHCVPIHEVLQVPDSPNEIILVMPLLLGWHQVRFDTFGEVVDFFNQLFEGLEFMHEQRVAHGDINFLNVMMDARSMFLSPWHPINPRKEREWNGSVRNYPRTLRPPRYFLTDFGLSGQHNYSTTEDVPGVGSWEDVDLQERIQVAVARVEAEVAAGAPAELVYPERTPSVRQRQRAALKRMVIDNADETVYTAPKPRYPLERDIYELGDFIREQFIQERRGFEFMQSLVDDMTLPDAWKRPSMSTVVSRFKIIADSLPTSKLRSRVIKTKDNSFIGFFRAMGHRIGYIALRIPATPDVKNSKKLRLRLLPFTETALAQFRLL